VCNKFFYIQHQVHRRHRGARKRAKASKIKARSSRPCTNCSLYRCAYGVHNYDAQQHRAGQMISPLTLQTITIAQMLSVGWQGTDTRSQYRARVTSRGKNVKKQHSATQYWCKFQRLKLTIRCMQTILDRMLWQLLPGSLLNLRMDFENIHTHLKHHN